MEKIINFLTRIELPKEAEASTNPDLAWMKFVFTDNKPNANKQGIPSSAFASILRTGILMPLKMADGGIAPDHKNALPIGVISSLENKNDELVNGQAALWTYERPDDVEMLRQAYASGQDLNISWEVNYTNSTIDENGVEWLNDPTVRAATLVGYAAYKGRTPVTSLASEIIVEPPVVEEAPVVEAEAAEWTTEYKNNLPDSTFLYVESGGKKDKEGKTVPRSLRHLPYKDADGKVDSPHLRNALTRLGQPNTGSGEEWLTDALKKRLVSKAQKLSGSQTNANLETEMEIEQVEQLLAKAQDDLKVLEGVKAELETALEAEKKTTAEKDAELGVLKEFKADVEKKESEAALLNSRLTALKDNGINFTDEEIASKKEMFLKLDDVAFGFLVSELKGRTQASASLNTENQIPGPLSASDDNDDPLEIVRKGLAERNSKK